MLHRCVDHLKVVLKGLEFGELCLIALQQLIQVVTVEFSVQSYFVFAYNRLQILSITHINIDWLVLL